jgi:hypothetical protein
VRRPTRARPALGLAAVVLLVAATGCGEKGEPATTGPVVPQATSPVTGSTTTTNPIRQTDPAMVSAAARAYLTSTDGAKVCDNLITPELLKQAYGNRSGCIAARKPQTVAKTATIKDVQVRGATASVTARAEGGQFGNGETVTLTVVRDGQDWRVAHTQQQFR